ncbi:MAG: MBL fold metallo-hydrolase [Bacteroidota bacterium]
MKITPIENKLQLSNSGNLEIVFIGVGSAFATTLHHTNFFIIKGDTHILVDFGTTGPSALKHLSIDPLDVEVLLPTHSHCDHVGGVEYLTLLNRYVAVNLQGRPKIHMIISEEYQDILWDATLRGGMEWNEVNQFGSKLVFEDYYDVTRPVLKESDPRQTLELDFNGIHLEFFRTNHIPDTAHEANQAFITYGLMIDGRVFISGDTKFDRDLIDQYAESSEVMFHDTSFFPNPVHASLEELRTLSKKVKKKMYLMHYSDNWREQNIIDFAGFAKEGVRYIFE